MNFERGSGRSKGRVGVAHHDGSDVSESVGAQSEEADSSGGGMPTFDIQFYGSQPYLSGGASKSGGSPPLTIPEYLRFIESLPDVTMFESDPRLALQHIQQLQNENPALASRHPAKEVFERVVPELKAMVALRR